MQLSLAAKVVAAPWQVGGKQWAKLNTSRIDIRTRLIVGIQIDCASRLDVSTFDIRSHRKSYLLSGDTCTNLQTIQPLLANL